MTSALWRPGKPTPRRQCANSLGTCSQPASWHVPVGTGMGRMSWGDELWGRPPPSHLGLYSPFRRPPEQVSNWMGFLHVQLCGGRAKPAVHTVIPAFRKQRDWKITSSLRPAWGTEWVPGQTPTLHREKNKRAGLYKVRRSFSQSKYTQLLSRKHSFVCGSIQVCTTLYCNLLVFLCVAH